MENQKTYTKILYENEVLWALYEIREQELSEVARTVCDDISQLLYAVRVQLSSIARSSTTADPALEESSELVGTAIQGLRHVRRYTTSRSADWESMALIEMLNDELKTTGGPNCPGTFRVKGKPFVLNQGTELIVRRMLQEILGSVQSRTQSQPLDVEVIYADSEIHFVVTFDGPLVPLESSAGLQVAGLSRHCLSERAALLGGDIKIQTGPAATRLELIIPKKSVVMNNTTKVALVEDHTMVRRALVRLLEDMGFSVCLDCSDGQDLMNRIDRNNLPDVVLMDINMPVMNGYETTRWLSDTFPLVKVLALSMLDREEDVIRMIRNGARGYIVKDSDPAVLNKAINTLMTEHFYYSDLLSGALVHRIRKMDEEGLGGGTVKLKEREVEFLKYACTEMTYKQIADVMCLSPRTVDGYRDDLFEKLAVTSRVGLVLYAIKNGIVSIN